MSQESNCGREKCQYSSLVWRRVKLSVKAGRLKFTMELAALVRDEDEVFIAVGRPSRRGDGHADLS